MRGGRSPPPAYRSRRSPPPSRPKHAPVQNPQPSNVLGVFGLSIRSTERDLDEEFSRFGRVEKVTIVYDQRSDRSRGFGFIKLASVEDAARCIQELNGVELNGRRIRVDYSVTERPHAPTPGEYMGHRRNTGRDYDRRDRGPYRESYRERDIRRDYDERDRYYDRERYDRYDRYSDKDRYSDRGRDRDPYGRDRDWRHRSPAPVGRYGSDRHRRSYSRSPPRGSSPARIRDYDIPPASAAALNGDPRW
ncbi:RNA-binding domain-containing protein [Fomitiporia mediterranea MF3/22]|uniref:RNA-binding domain-containing protein n=1 Tax=Fomitiporia mediterranea (strain MF3/22) TaxID=694068 RepID=UPI000440875D|nr:RNA-binding domain-containing protein [Fomitiporia mediterranea MF3/22]EJD00978.1 RNA-binding domain-containing protein [Fomitiporia mediterranea MF3/22]